MKKNYFNLILLLVVGFMITANSSCKKEKVKASSNHDGDFYIEAWDVTGQNLLEGVETVTLLQRMMDEKGLTYRIDEVNYINDGFKFKMPSSYPDNQLRNISELFKHATYSNAKVLFAKVDELAGHNPNIDPHLVGTFHFGDDINNGKERYTTHWIYVNRDVEITGEHTEEAGIYTYEYRYKYDVSLKEGWNLVHESRFSERDGRLTIYTHSYSNEKPTDITFRWFLKTLVMDKIGA